MQSLVRVLIILPLLALGACATIVEGDDQTVSVITDPPGATCMLTREGVTVGVANPTPSSVVLEKDSDNISVICKKSGHFDGASTLSSSFQNLTFGNVIFGGIIGVVVDAASGAPLLTRSMMNSIPSYKNSILSAKPRGLTEVRHGYAISVSCRRNEFEV